MLEHSHCSFEDIQENWGSAFSLSEVSGCNRIFNDDCAMHDGVVDSSNGYFDIYELVSINGSNLVIDSGVVLDEENKNEDVSLMGDLFDQYKFALAHPEASFSSPKWESVREGQGSIDVTQTIGIDEGNKDDSKKYGDLLNLSEKSLESAFGLLGRDLFPDMTTDRPPEVLRLFAKQGEMDVDKSFASILPPMLSQREHHELTGDSPFSAPRCVGGDQG